MNICDRNCCWRADFHALRCDSGFALPYREHLPRIVALNLRSRLLALLTSNSGEGFPKVSINASRVTKRIIEDRFHWRPEAWLCHTSVFISERSKMRSWLEQVSIVQRLGSVGPF